MGLGCDCANCGRRSALRIGLNSASIVIKPLTQVVSRKERVRTRLEAMLTFSSIVQTAEAQVRPTDTMQLLPQT